jgi:hypothetical protein
MGLSDILGQEPTWNQVQTGSDSDGASDMLTPDVGDTVIGTYMGSSEHLSKFPNSKTGKMDKYNQLLKFKLVDGSDAVLWAKGNLWYQMKDVEEGTLVKLERLPDEKSKQGFTVSTWVVFTAS